MDKAISNYKMSDPSILSKDRETTNPIGGCTKRQMTQEEIERYKGIKSLTKRTHGDYMAHLKGVGR